jgi:methionine-gamma-lyase
VDDVQFLLGKEYTYRHGSPLALMVTSGLHAVSAALYAVTKSRDRPPFHLVHGSELYDDTLEVFGLFAGDYGGVASITPINVANTAGILELFRTRLAQKDNVLFVEACSNPHGHVFDFRCVPELRACSKSFILIVDNTWTSALFNPFSYGADIVVLSLTKYYSGGRAIGGACLFADMDLHDVMDRYLLNYGFYVSAWNARIIADMIPGVRERVARSGAVALDAAQKLGAAGVVVCHPSLPSHPSAELARLFFAGPVSVMVLRMPFPPPEGFALKTSYGAPESRPVGLVAPVAPVRMHLGVTQHDKFKIRVHYHP